MSRTGHLPSALLALTLAVAVPAGPASAATEADCKAAVAEVERAMQDDAALEIAPEGKRDRIESILAEAGEAGLQGNYERCMERVEAAKGIAGLR